MRIAFSMIVLLTVFFSELVTSRNHHGFSSYSFEQSHFIGAQARRLLGTSRSDLLQGTGQLKIQFENPAPFLLATVKARLLQVNSTADPEKLTHTLIREGNRNKIDPLLLLAIIAQESSTNPNAIGRHGEIGLMQIKPATAEWIADRRGFTIPSRADLFDPCINVRLGAAYLAYLSERFPTSKRGFLKAYNLGPSGWLKKRTTNYHHRVLRHYEDLLFNFSRTGPPNPPLELQASL